MTLITKDQDFELIAEYLSLRAQAPRRSLADELSSCTPGTVGELANGERPALAQAQSRAAAGGGRAGSSITARSGRCGSTGSKRSSRSNSARPRRGGRDRRDRPERAANEHDGRCGRGARGAAADRCQRSKGPRRSGAAHSQSHGHYGPPRAALLRQFRAIQYLLAHVTRA